MKPIDSKIVALFGGAFDPFHNGHEAVVETVLSLEYISEVYLIPTGIAKHKALKAGAVDRSKMISDWIEARDYSNVYISDFETNTPSPSYTIETVSHFQKEFPDTQFVWVMGLDSFYSLHKWYQWERLLSKVPFLILNRDEFDQLEMRNYAFKFLDLPDLSAFTLQVMPEVDVSSSDIRRRIERGEVFSSMVPHEVASYISEKRLYL